MTSEAPLPDEVAQHLRAWGLSPDGPLLTTRSSWVLPVRRQADAAVLKVARILDEQAGFRLMSWWKGKGAALVFASAAGALLLERSVGSRSLARMARFGQDDEACRILCRTAADLHAPRPPPHFELHLLEQWFEPLFALAPNHTALTPAAEMARALVAAQRDVCPLHGDLHHGNVLDFSERGWLAIDPKGLVGERTFDFANIFTNPDLDEPAQPVATLPGRLETRLGIVTGETGIEASRILGWLVAWTGLSAAWFISDGDQQRAEIDLQINAHARQLLRP